MRSIFGENFLANSLERFLSAFLVIALLVFGFFQGLDRVAIELSYTFLYVNIAVIDALSSVIGFSLFILFCTVLSFGQILRQSRVTESSEDKTVTAIIPTYQDSHALERSVPSLVKLDYPGLEIMIVCEEDDEEAINKCQELENRFESVNYTINDLSPGTKAGAVNCGAEETSSDAIFVFDADQEVKHGFVRKSIDLLFDKGYDVVQSRVVPRPEGFIETLCYCEALFVYVIPERLADFFTNYKVAGSRGTGMSRQTFTDLEGYNPDFLTEDMDFAFRCYEEGLDVKPLLSEVCTEEAPHTIWDYWGQRKRWVKGHIEVFASRLRYFWQSPGITYAKSSILSGIIPIGWFFLILLVSKFLLLLIIGFNFVALGALANLVIISAIFRYMDRKVLERYSLLNYLSLLGAPLIFPLYGLVAIKALFEFLIRGESNWYRVEKT